jgi:hypothetical protein
MATLTPEQRQEIQKAGAEPVRISDPETQTEYLPVSSSSTPVGERHHAG